MKFDITVQWIWLHVSQVIVLLTLMPCILSSVPLGLSTSRSKSCGLLVSPLSTYFDVPVVLDELRGDILTFLGAVWFVAVALPVSVRGVSKSVVYLLWYPCCPVRVELLYPYNPRSVVLLTLMSLLSCMSCAAMYLQSLVSCPTHFDVCCPVWVVRWCTYNPWSVVLLTLISALSCIGWAAMSLQSSVSRPTYFDVLVLLYELSCYVLTILGQSPYLLWCPCSPVWVEPLCPYNPRSVALLTLMSLFSCMSWAAMSLQSSVSRPTYFDVLVLLYELSYYDLISFGAVVYLLWCPCCPGWVAPRCPYNHQSRLVCRCHSPSPGAGYERIGRPGWRG